MGVRIDKQGLMRADGSWLLCLEAELMTQRWGAGFVAVHRAELQQLLAAELDPAVIHLGAHCTGLQDNGRDAAATTLIARNVGAMGQWQGRSACAVRDALMRTTPRSVQLRQLDLVLALRTGRDDRQAPR